MYYILFICFNTTVTLYIHLQNDIFWFWKMYYLDLWVYNFVYNVFMFCMFIYTCIFDNSLLSCLPNIWTRLILNSENILYVTCSNIEQFEKNRNCIKACKTFYNIFLRKQYTERLINPLNKWENMLNVKELNCQMTLLLIIHWKCFSTSFSTEPSQQYDRDRQQFTLGTPAYSTITLTTIFESCGKHTTLRFINKDIYDKWYEIY